MLGLSLVPILDKTLGEILNTDYDEKDFVHTKNTMYGSNVNNAILKDSLFRPIFLGAVRRKKTSGYNLIERYNEHLVRGDNTLFKTIPLETLGEIVLSVREASILYKLSQTSKRIRIFLSEPHILSLLRKEKYPDDKLERRYGPTEKFLDFESWYFKTFFTEQCTVRNGSDICAKTAFQLKRLDYLIEKKLIPYASSVDAIFNENKEWFSGAERVVEYINLLYSIAEETVEKRERVKANSTANFLLARYIEYSAWRGVFFDLPSILNDEKYEIEFMKSNEAHISIWTNRISRGNGRETYDRIMKSSLHYKQ